MLPVAPATALLVSIVLACGGAPGTEPNGDVGDSDAIATDSDERDTETAPVDASDVDGEDVGGPDVPSLSQLELPRLEAAAEAIDGVFSEERAMALVAEVDRYFRVRGNEGYVRSLEHVETYLEDGGFVETSDPAQAGYQHLSLGPVEPTWTPRSAHLELVTAEGDLIEVLAAFDDESERDRATLLVGSDLSDGPAMFEVIDGGAVDHPSEATDRVVLDVGSSWQVGQQWLTGAGAAGILLVDREPYHARLDDDTAAPFDYLRGSGFGFSMSVAAETRLREALAAGSTYVRVTIDVEWGEGSAGCVEARIPGQRTDLGPVVLVAHADEPGANDNASGVAALAELAMALHSAVETGDLTRPDRPIVFLWGQEYEVAQEWLRLRSEEGAAAPVAGLVLDMVGSDPAVIGAPFLIERAPDPAAIWLRAPDEHTEWGQADPSMVIQRPTYLNDYVLAATRIVADREGGWDARSNPFEGGSDHEPFLWRGIPALLAWHFTDPAYHTSADRLERVSGPELRRVSAAIGAATWGVASGAVDDAFEILASVEAAAHWRADVALDGALGAFEICSPVELEQSIAGEWSQWYDGALASVESAPTGGASTELDEAIASARAAWETRALELVEAVAEIAPEARDHCRSKAEARPR